MAEQTYSHGLIDTDVLIDSSHRIPQAAAFINGMTGGDGVLISAITVLEMIVGCRDARQLNALKVVVSEFKIVHLTPEVSQLAQSLMESYTLSHGLEMADALIAATAVVLRLPLYTRNVRHYKTIPDLLVIKPY